MRRVLLFPSLTRMDHAKAAIELKVDDILQAKKRAEGKQDFKVKDLGTLDLAVILVPLQEGTRAENLNTFANEVLANHEIDGCIVKYLIKVWEKPLEKEPGEWGEKWRNWLLSIYNHDYVSVNDELTVVLTPDLPLGVILSTATISLAMKNLEIVELPVGYNLSTSPSGFHPAEPLRQQAIRHTTWGSAGMRTSLLAVAGSPRLVELLQIIRELAEAASEPGLLPSRVVSRRLISNKYGSKPPKASALSQRLSRLIETDLIERVAGKHAFRMTSDGVLVSGLLRND